MLPLLLKRRNGATDFRLDIFQPFPKLGQFRRRDQDHVELDDHQARKLEILRDFNMSNERPRSGLKKVPTHIILFQNLSQITEDALRIQIEAQLADDQTSASLEQAPICAEQLEQVDQEAREIPVIGVGRDLG